MAIIKTIPWTTGGGNIILTFDGQGDGVVTVESDSDSPGYDRQQTLTIRSMAGLTAYVVVTQYAGVGWLCDKNGYRLNAQWHPLTVAPAERHAVLQAKGATLYDKNGKRLRTTEE